MRKFIFLWFILFAFTAIYAQSSSRPVVDESLQKANKRPPQTVETQKKNEKQTNSNDENSSISEPISDSAQAVTDDEVLRIDTNLVTVPVRVSDHSNRYLAGLKKEDFKIYEDGKEQEIAYFSDAEEPFTVALVLDMSYSSTFKINEIHMAAMAFINQLHPNDRVMVVSFDEEVHVLCEPTNNREILQRAVKQTQVGSGTSLYEAVDLIINQRFKKISGRKAVVLFTDGVDTTSRKAYGAGNLRDALETDSLIYPIEYDTYNDVQQIKNSPPTVGGGIPQGGGSIPTSGGGTRSPFPFPFPGTGSPSSTTIPGTNIPRTTGGGGNTNKSPLPFPVPTTPSSKGTSAEDYRVAEEYLQGLADNTSGRVYKANTTANLAAAFTNIANELRQIYSLGFYPADESSGKRRQLKVKVNKDGAVVRSRDSYVVGKKN